MIKKIAVFGEQYTNTDLVRPLFTGTEGAEIVYFSEIEEIFEVVDSGEVSRGIVPKKNSTRGDIKPTVRALEEYPNIRVAQSVSQAIEHHLLGVLGATLGSIQRVSSQESCLGQCAQWLEANLPNAVREVASSTAAAARMVSEAGDKTHAAIASRAAAEAYGLEILAENIQPHGEGVPENVTEFIMICKKKQI